jgi:spore maturation protein CgeB
MADLHCLVREADVARYRSWGLPFIKTMFSFDPAMQFAPDNWSDANRDRDISYIGQPYEERPAFLRLLASQYQLPVFINGNHWQELLARDPVPNIKVGGHLDAAHYRDGIWRSKVNLSFVARDNEDDIAHKSVEIGGCGAFLLALRTPGHQALFEEEIEAAFFSSIEECADKARFYLDRPDLRESIGRRARIRAIRSGYDNDTQLTRILNRLDGKD